MRPFILTIAVWIAGPYDVRGDLDLDGDVDADDGAKIVTTSAGGRGNLSLTASLVRPGYAGYHHEPWVNMNMAIVRNRVLLMDLGRWSRRDPLGYVDGMSMYGYVRSDPVGGVDPMGLWSRTLGTGRGGVTGCNIDAGCIGGGEVAAPPRVTPVPVPYRNVPRPNDQGPPELPNQHCPRVSTNATQCGDCGLTV